MSCTLNDDGTVTHAADCEFASGARIVRACPYFAEASDASARQVLADREPERQEITCDWPGCFGHRERDFLYCAAHLTAEIDRWLEIERRYQSGREA